MWLVGRSVWKYPRARLSLSIMTAFDIDQLSPQERIDLIGRLWDSLDAEAVGLTPAQQAELERRLATRADDVRDARPADEVLTELRRRYG